MQRRRIHISLIDNCTAVCTISRKELEKVNLTVEDFNLESQSNSSMFAAAYLESLVCMVLDEIFHGEYQYGKVYKEVSSDGDISFTIKGTKT